MMSTRHVLIKFESSFECRYVRMRGEKKPTKYIKSLNLDGNSSVLLLMLNMNMKKCYHARKLIFSCGNVHSH